MKETAAKHLAELETVLETSKGLNSLIEFWAFRAAYDEVCMNLSYVKRQRNEKNTVEADKFIASLEELYTKYENIRLVEHYYELDN